MDNQEALVDSLLKRIYVSSEEDARSIVSDLESRYNYYRECIIQRDQLDKKLSEILKQKKRDGVSVPKLEFMETKDELRNWKMKTHTAEKQVLAFCSSIPNLLTDFNLISHTNAGAISSDSYLKHLLDDCRTEKKVRSSAFELDYQVGVTALLELELCGYISQYLCKSKLTEVTTPAFVRQEVIESLGFSYQDKDTYTLQTKAQLHADVGFRSKDTVGDRQAKPEDHDVYKAYGVTDTSLMLYFMRQTTPQHTLPLSIFAIGNQYRLPFVGKPRQSKVVAILSTAQSAESALKLFKSNVELTLQLWTSLGVVVEMKRVEPHLLAHHEAAAVECEMLTSQQQRPVLSRLSLSNDHVSRKMMATFDGSVVDDKFLHFTAGEFADITVFIEALQNSNVQ